MRPIAGHEQRRGGRVKEVGEARDRDGREHREHVLGKRGPGRHPAVADAVRALPSVNRKGKVPCNADRRALARASAWDDRGRGGDPRSRQCGSRMTTGMSRSVFFW